MGLMNYMDLKTIDVDGVRVFLRLDLNVPMKDGKIIDATRIDEALPTIQYLLESGAKVVAASHRGRPRTEEDFQNLSLEPIAEALNERGIEVLLMDKPDSDAPLDLMKKLKPNQIILLENLRFSNGETENSQALAQKWSRYTDIFVNDAFGACHRAHASIHAMAQLKPIRCFGFLVEKEIAALNKIADKPPAPFVFVTGGSKVSDKIAILDSFAEKSDAVLIGGAMAYTFLAAQGFAVGNSKLEKDKISVAKKFLQRMEARGKKVLLPVDHMVVSGIGADDFRVSDGTSVPADSVAVDIGPKTQRAYAELIKSAGSVFWNGPMGMYETPPCDQGSLAVAEAMSQCEGFTVVGGGDSAAVMVQSGWADKISHISTGGGASMEYLQGVALPGLEVLKVRTVV